MSNLRIWVAGVVAFLAAVALALSQLARAASADPTFGDWLTAMGDGKVRVGPCASNPVLACGTLIWFRPPADAPPGPAHDIHNPDRVVRERPIQGILIISDFRRAAPGRWTDGKIYDPNDGRTYRSKMVAGSDGKLKVAGCVLFFCKAQTWTRTN